MTPSENGHYDLQELKDDAQWLSDQAWIDEMAALRLGILEWQTRPAAQLLSGFTEEETLSVREAAGSTNLGASRLASSILAAGDNQSGNFFSQDQRRFRLLKLLISEKVQILRVSETLARTFAYSEDDTGDTPHEWLLSIGASVFAGHKQDGTGEGSSFGFVEHCVIGLQRRMERLEKGSGWYEAEGGSPAIEEVWGMSQLCEMVYILQLAFVHIDQNRSLPPSRTVLAWFRFAARSGFFREFYEASNLALAPDRH